MLAQRKNSSLRPSKGHRKVAVCSRPRGLQRSPSAIVRNQQPGSTGLQPAEPSQTTSHGPKSPAKKSLAEALKGRQPGSHSPQLLMDRRQLLLGTVAVTTGMLNCPCCVPQAKAWGYGDQTGPYKWEGVCQAGTKQSPINLPVTSASFLDNASFGDFRFNYKNFREGCEVFNTGHGTMQVNFPPGNRAYLADKELELLQFHFHAPSEHAIDGKRYAMEAHLVHRNLKTGGLAVLGAMLEPVGFNRNPTLDSALLLAPREPLGKIPATRAIDPRLLLPPTMTAKMGDMRRQYLHYPGSLTTPPCSEGVDWFVFMEPVKINAGQVLEFMRFVGDGLTYATNSRPLQPLFDRSVVVNL